MDLALRFCWHGATASVVSLILWFSVSFGLWFALLPLGTMRVSASIAVLCKTRWYEYAIRSVFGGGITLLAGVIAKKFGPVVGGLFLVFQRSFPHCSKNTNARERKKQESRAGHPRQASGRVGCTWS
jgi:hypothetical protein